MLDAIILSCLQIPQTVANGENTRGIADEAMACLHEQTRLGFAAIAACFWTVRAKEYAVDMATDRTQFVLHFTVNRIEGVDIEQTPGQARLVGGNNNPVTRLIEIRDGLQAAGNGDPLFR